MMLLAAMTMCLNIDGVDVPPIQLTEPLSVTVEASGPVVKPGRWDVHTVEMVLRGRGFSEAQIRAAVKGLRLVQPGTEEVKCGTCVAGTLTGKWPKTQCVEGASIKQACMICKVCADPLPEPIACLR